MEDGLKAMWFATVIIIAIVLIVNFSLYVNKRYVEQDFFCNSKGFARASSNSYAKDWKCYESGSLMCSDPYTDRIYFDDGGFQVNESNSYRCYDLGYKIGIRNW